MQVMPGVLVRHAKKLDWGMGIVIAQPDPETAEVFFVSSGRRIIKQATTNLWLLKAGQTLHPILKAATQISPEAWQKAHHHVYAVELSPMILRVRAFREANPHQDYAKILVYVGMTGLTPEERLENHFNGRKAAGFMRRFGVRLLPAFYSHFNPMPFKIAQAMEIEVADTLRGKGYGVWQH